MIDLSIVEIVNEKCSLKSVFAGNGISGYQIAKRLSEEHLSSDDVLRSHNVIGESGESSLLINKTGSHFQNQFLIIISGSTEDPDFLSLRKMALSSSFKFLWTILGTPGNTAEHPASIQPQKNESITIIPPGSDYVENSFVLVKALIHFIHVPSLVCMEVRDVMSMFAGHWTKILNVETNNQSYSEDIQRFIMHNITHLQHAGSVGLFIFGGISISFDVLHVIVNLFVDNMSPDIRIYFTGFVVEDFDPVLHVAIITGDKIINNHNN